MTKFYTFRQNNSGGRDDYDESKGISKFVIIEASNAEHASRRARRIGLYFDGCSAGIDCDCCGDRWYEVNESDGSSSPEIYGKSPEKYPLNLMSEGECFCFIHHLNGTGTGFRKGAGKRSGLILGPGSEGN